MRRPMASFASERETYALGTLYHPHWEESSPPFLTRQNPRFRLTSYTLGHESTHPYVAGGDDHVFIYLKTIGVNDTFVS